MGQKQILVKSIPTKKLQEKVRADTVIMRSQQERQGANGMDKVSRASIEHGGGQHIDMNRYLRRRV